MKRFIVGSLNWEGSGQRAEGRVCGGGGEEEDESAGALSSRSAAIAFQSLSLALSLGFFAAAVVNLFPFAGKYWSASVGHFLVVPGVRFSRGPVSRNEEERGRENNACRLFSFPPQVFCIALEGYLTERAEKTECAGAFAFRLPRELLSALKH